MNFKTFAVGTTNVFPASNTVHGGQYLSEWNLRSRESVATDKTVNYMIGPSYTHGELDFAIGKQTDGSGAVISSTVLEINEGRAIVNGHYIESLVPMYVDLLESNIKLRQESLPPLNGRLCVGLRVMYSTEATMAGSVIPENDENYYEGIQVVILPKDQFYLPSDKPNEPNQVTAHLKLGEFDFINNTISTVIQNIPDKYQTMSADRIKDVDSLISEGYVGKTGLNPNKIYAFSGKGTDPATGQDTWCDSTDSLIVWDKTPQTTLQKPYYQEAKFIQQPDRVTLCLPHKQVDGMKNTKGQPQYYATVFKDLPVADYSKGTSGVINYNYTNHIRNIESKIDNFYQFTKGKQVGYIEVYKGEGLPELNQNWHPGDYILVGEDHTQVSADGGVRPPSTMYVVLPGLVKTIKYVGQSANPDTPTVFPGVCISSEIVSEEPSTEDMNVMNSIFGIPSANHRGIPIQLDGSGNLTEGDYFTAVFVDGSSGSNRTRTFYYGVESSGPKEYSSAIYLTREIPLASEEVTGGFRNVSETQAIDGGYVFRDEYGHLRLVDYALLRSGTLAYQLNADFTVPNGLTAEAVQDNLNEYVNYRIAFRNITDIDSTIEDPYVIHIYIPIPEEIEGQSQTINVVGIDSRFQTSVYLHLQGECTELTQINIIDCAKIRVDSNIPGTPRINLMRSSLYYDASVLNKLNKIEDMSLWYERYSSTDPNLIVDNMTVIETDSPILPEDIDVWSETIPNDNHYSYALRSVTFGKDGSIIGCEMYIRNDTTSNIERQKSIIVHPFKLPEGSGLTYPVCRMTKQLKITGSFISGYPVDNPNGYNIINTQFTAITNPYDQYNPQSSTEGTISIFSDQMFIDNVEGIGPGTQIDGWETSSFHIFSGGSIG